MKISSVFGALASLSLRLLVVAAATAAVVPAVLFFGYLGGSSAAKGWIASSWLIAFAGIAWSLWPLLRLGWLAAAIALALWVTLGTYASSFGAAPVKGYPLPMWISASVVLFIPFLLKPPLWVSLLRRQTTPNVSFERKSPGEPSASSHGETLSVNSIESVMRRRERLRSALWATGISLSLCISLGSRASMALAYGGGPLVLLFLPMLPVYWLFGSGTLSGQVPNWLFNTLAVAAQIAGTFVVVHAIRLARAKRRHNDV